MPSLLETAIRNHRAAMLAEDARALATVLDAYVPARARLIKRIDGLVTTMQERPLTVTEMLRWDRAKELFTQIDVEVARLSKLANTQIIDSQGKLVAMAGDHAKALALVSANNPGTAAQISGNWNRINPGATEALIGRMSDGSPLQETLGRYGPEARSSITEALKRSIVLGTNPRATAAELAKTLDVSAAKLLRITRTEQLQSYRAATLANYRANDDIISGWRWISAHQTRTCMACLSLDGEVFPLTVEFQPSHVQCRCSSIPEINGEPTPDRQTGQQYFDSLSDEDKRKIVPASALNDIESGKLQLRDFRQLNDDPRWGKSYTQASVTSARANAAKRGQTFTSTPPKATEPTFWSPSMTAEKAQTWSSESVMKDTLFHGTSEEGFESIPRDGFDLSRRSNGKFFGDGVYLSESKGTAQTYGDVLNTKINVKNVLHVTDEIDGADVLGSLSKSSPNGQRLLDIRDEIEAEYSQLSSQFNPRKIVLSPEEEQIADLLDSPRFKDPHAAAINQFAQEEGIDAIRIANGGSRDIDIWVIFDSKNVTVVT